MTIEILAEAERDLSESYAFYFDRDIAWVRYFLDSLASDIESLHFHAGIHSVHWGYHRLLAKRFPFAIYYTVDNDLVRIWAILDCRRNPDTIEQRLT